MIGLLRWISLGTSCGIVYSLTAVAVRVLVGFKGFKHPWGELRLLPGSVRGKGADPFW